MEPKKVLIELTTKEWNVVLLNLSRGPYSEVSEVIAAITAQAKEQLAKPAPIDE